MSLSLSSLLLSSWPEPSRVCDHGPGGELSQSYWSRAAKHKYSIILSLSPTCTDSTEVNIQHHPPVNQTWISSLFSRLPSIAEYSPLCWSTWSWYKTTLEPLVEYLTAMPGTDFTRVNSLKPLAERPEKDKRPSRELSPSLNSNSTMYQSLRSYVGELNWQLALVRLLVPPQFWDLNFYISKFN